MQSIIRFGTLVGIFAVPAVVFIVSETMFFPYITGKNFTFRILVEIITAGWVVLALLDAQYRPRRSWILSAFALLLGAMFISDVLSPAPLKSFMSNFERMDGYVTLVHTFLYFLVTASMLTTEKLWQQFFGWNVVLATLLAGYGILQASGQAAVSQGASWRIDGTLGNSSYMAVYMLFSACIATMYALKTQVPERRWAAGVLALIFAALIFQTGTRGTVLGLLAGGGTAALFLAVRGASMPRVRKVASGALILGVLLVGSFVALRDTALVQNSPTLERLTHISLSEGGIRFTNWGMAWEGVKERPLFGWGHESFNYVFNTYYNPAMYGAEEWYDRAHNIVFDWLVQGGFIGATLYFGLIGIALALLMRRTSSEETEEGLLVRALLAGLLVAYTVHNFFVFDNVVSYIYFALVLAYIHRMHAGEPYVLPKLGEEAWAHVAVPVGVILLAGVLYAVNVPGIRTAQGIIDALTTTDGTARMVEFERVLTLDSFGNQEVREQLLQFIAQAAPSAASEEARTQLLAVAEREINAQIAEKPGDARIYILAGGMYRSVGLPAAALQYYTEALKLTPEKTSLKHDLGLTYISLGDTEKGLAYLQDAYEKDTSKMRARMIYALGAIHAGKMELYDELVAGDEALAAAATTDFLYQALYGQKEFARVQALYRERIALEPTSYDARKNYAIVAYNMGKIVEAITILEIARAEMSLTDAQSAEIQTMIEELQKEKK
ncbi:hypothetical protein A3C89_03405 [Candidatus Kaiserbacteria bacterium RIFCSPHIGHO2_02_FULL_50_50]|uniref:O-antigen ligase-related domain-containing protein n=1 Tax=Candidatus Kaiserbacteria bacterium RIFCSPHIGHO2_02_FULL_50_50 TaxID=1798492 RepID=A0A1F6DEZ1_9BACT|nr:MAG: hypothetical protein A3C89_03405 [Candidatus Kaiserbacteria bacterium RIFCSPHIGHO2_02_FULL_50_50]OGG89224.1 MAG: hypothetical protein A3G62_01215 [Candidatus Kaiserbacteria bacterium RIFCSPLOWO2_12_FULL_50_10]